MIEIAPQLKQPGRVQEVVVVPNQPVKKGDLLFRVDPVPYQNAAKRLTAALKEAEQSKHVAEASVALATAGLDRANASLNFATSDRDRKASLLDTQAVSQEEFDAAQNRFMESAGAVAQAEASLTQAQLSIELASTRIDQAVSQLESAEYDLEQVDVVAPGDGCVTNLQLRPGALVGGGTGSGSGLYARYPDRGNTDYVPNPR